MGSGMIPLMLAVLGGALLGSVPFGLLLTRAAGLGDIRAIGSGNIGATNVLRTGRKDIAALTLLLDGAKGSAAVLLAQWLTGQGGLVGGLAGGLAGVAAVVGHCYSVWLGGKGGKGAATGLGVIIGLNWMAGIGACLVWLGAARLSRISSVGALAAFAVAPLLLFYWNGWRIALCALAIAAVVFWRHRANIQRLRAGTEPRIGQAKPAAANGP